MQRSYRSVSDGLFHEILLTFVELNSAVFNTWQSRRFAPEEWRMEYWILLTELLQTGGASLRKRKSHYETLARLK